MAEEKLIFLPHTHWDREWYLPFEQFREKLVQLIDQLIKIMRENPSYKYFLLDGQAIILEDYLEVKGESPELKRLIQEGRLGVGPWYVLPDEFLVSGEALIRNLEMGFELARKLGVEPVKVGYLPDMFGHISQMPQILCGFGMDCAVVWRGVPKMERNQFRWQSREGSCVLALYLPLGYGSVFDLSGSLEEFLKKLKLLFPLLKFKDESGVYLIPVGTDHWFPEPDLPELLNRGSELKKQWQMSLGTLEEFFSELKTRLEKVPSYLGELRSNEQTQILPGVASARLYLKEMNHRASAILEKYLEPLLALDWIYSGAEFRDRLGYLWRLLLRNHPHDSICGCSVDLVHQEMEVRFKKILELSEILLKQVSADLACPTGLKQERISVWTPTPDATPGVLVFETGLFGNKDLALEDETGRTYPLERVEQTKGKEILFEFEVPAHLAGLAFSWLSPEQIFGLFPISFQRRSEGEKLLLEIGLGEEQINLSLREEFARVKAFLEKEKFSGVKIQLYRMPVYKMVSVIEELKGPGISSFKVKRVKAKTEKAVISSEAGLENQWLKLSMSERGELKIMDKGSGKEILMGFSDQGDRGDSYNFDPVKGEERISLPEKFRVKLGPQAERFASLELDHFFSVPVSLARGREKRSEKKTLLSLHTRVYLYAGAHRVDFETSFENTVKDHRLRVDFFYPELLDHFFAETGFDLVKRRIENDAPPSSSSSKDLSQLLFGSEGRYSTSPIQNFACLEGKGLGIILAGRGLKEIGAEREERKNQTRLSFTLCRAIGYLARSDLVFRKGLAGPPLEVPEAQCLRKFRWDYSLLFFTGSLEAGSVFSRAYQFVFPPLVFPGESRGRLPFQVKSPKIILSAFYLGKGPTLIARFFNPSFQAERLELELDPRVVRVLPLSLEGKELSRPDFKFETHQRRLESILKPGEIFTLGMELMRKEQKK